MRWVGWLIAAGVVTGVCWFFPLFHIVPLERATTERASTVFSSKEFAEKFWNEQLLKSLDKATTAEVLLAAIQTNAGDAKKKFSRSVGVSESYTYFLSGKGRVLAANDDEISLAVTEGTTSPEISLQIGLLFGNAVRDGTGLLNVNDYPNSQDFNGISEALNHIIETRVQPKLREQAKVGAVVRFVGCAEVNDEANDLMPLKVIPITADVQ
jgi:predicted lipoprotein